MASLVAPSLHLERGSDMPFLPREPSPPRHVPRSPRRRRGGRWWLTGGALASPDSGEVISAEVALRSRPRLDHGSSPPSISTEKPCRNSRHRTPPPARWRPCPPPRDRLEGAR